MKFEEVLPLMRKGKKAFISSCTPYCYWTITSIYHHDGEILNKLTCLSYENGKTIINDDSWGFSRDLLISDDWEIVE